MRPSQSPIRAQRRLFGAAVCVAFLCGATAPCPARAGARAKAPAATAERAVFTGTVAGQPAVAMLDVTPDRIAGGVFFYRREGRDVALVATETEGQLRECRVEDGLPASPCESSGRWEVKLEKGRVRGTRQAAEGPGAGRIALERSRTGRAQPHTDAERSAYERLRLADARTTTVGRGSLGPVAWHVVREERSGVEGLVLTEAPNGKARKRINEDLARAFHADMAAALSGEKSAMHDLTVVFANERYVALTGENEVWSGGHPATTFFARTWDLATGAPVEWEERLRVVEPHAAGLDLTRSDLLAALVLERALRESAGDSGDEGDWCSGLLAQRYGCTGERCTMRASGASAATPLDPTQWAMYPTADGLAVAPDAYNEAERGCRGEAIVVPWTAANRARVGKRTLP